MNAVKPGRYVAGADVFSRFTVTKVVAELVPSLHVMFASTDSEMSAESVIIAEAVTSPSAGPTTTSFTDTVTGSLSKS